MEVEGKGEWREDDLINKSVLLSPSPCPVFTSVHNTPVSGEEFNSFLTPEGKWECLTHGTFERRNNLEVPATESAFARIPITFEDDDDDADEDEEEVQEKIEEEHIVTNSSDRNLQKKNDDVALLKQKAAVTVVEKDKEKGKDKEKEEDEMVYTRITITDDDDEEEVEEDEVIEALVDKKVEIKTESRQRNSVADSLGVQVEGVMPGNTRSATVDTTKGTERVEKQVVVDDQFTRIAIADDDDDDDDEGADVTVDAPVPGAPQHSSETQEGASRTAKQGHPATAALSVAKKESKVVTAPAGFSRRTPLTENDEKRKVVVESNGEQKKKKEVEKKEGGGGESRDSESLKAAGNDAMKALDYKGALELYTASLNLDQSNLLTRNNRAQTHLKLLNFKEAVTDATYVIEKDPSYPLGGAGTGTGGLPSEFSPSSVSSAVKKALFRRATVRTSKCVYVHNCGLRWHSLSTVIVSAIYQSVVYS
jgi:tetratricopeptide (TPR) repeat protein